MSKNEVTFISILDFMNLTLETYEEKMSIEDAFHKFFPDDEPPENADSIISNMPTALIVFGTTDAYRKEGLEVALDDRIKRETEILMGLKDLKELN